MKVGIIRVLTTDEDTILKAHGRLMEKRFGLNTVSKCIKNQPDGIYNAKTAEEAVPKITALAEELVCKNRCTAVTISCAADPGLNECRKVLDRPVLGAGSAGAYIAKMYCNKIGVIGITPDVPKSISVPLGSRLTCYTSPDGVNKTTDLFKPHAKKKFLMEIEKLIKAESDGILFACTGFSTMNMAEMVKSHFHIPVFDLVDAQAAAIKSLKISQV